MMFREMTKRELISVFVSPTLLVAVLVAVVLYPSQLMALHYITIVILAFTIGIQGFLIIPRWYSISRERGTLREIKKRHEALVAELDAVDGKVWDLPESIRFKDGG